MSANYKNLRIGDFLSLHSNQILKHVTYNTYIYSVHIAIIIMYRLGNGKSRCKVRSSNHCCVTIVNLHSGAKLVLIIDQSNQMRRAGTNGNPHVTVKFHIS